MAHPKALIESIRGQLALDYPVDTYRYVTEKRLPGTSFLPDIIIYDQANTIVCIVEVGYTRPEKLSHYTASGVTDVRWYDKQGHLHGEQYRRIVTTVVQKERPTVLVSFVGCVGQVCPKCFGAEDADEDTDEDCVVYSIVIRSDDDRYIVANFCDACGTPWCSDEEDDITAGIAQNHARHQTSLAPLQDVTMCPGLEVWHGSATMSWVAARQLVADHLGLELDAAPWLRDL